LQARATSACTLALMALLASGCFGGGGRSSRHAALVLGGATVSVVPASANVRPNIAPTGATDAAAIVAARNEFESFQVVIQAGGSQLMNVNVNLSGDLTGTAGTLPAKNVTIYREEYYNASGTSDLEGATGRWPDALIPKEDYFYGESRNAFPTIVPAGESRVAWIDVLVPQTQPAGEYKGSLTVSSSDATVTVPIKVTVKDFALPSPRGQLAFADQSERPAGLTTVFDLDINKPCPAHGGCATADAGWNLHALYVRAALENRVTIAKPFYGGLNTTYFRQYMLPFVNGTSSATTMPAQLRTRLPGARIGPLFLYNWCDNACIQSWKTEAEADGFAGNVLFYAYDEPLQNPAAWSQLKTNITRARSVWPGIPVATTATINDADDPNIGGTYNGAPIRNSIDVFIPLVQFLHGRSNDPFGNRAKYLGSQRDKYETWRTSDANNRVWTYTSCESFYCAVPSNQYDASEYFRGWPGYAIDEPATEERTLGWLSYKYRTSGEYYFETVNKLSTAWSDQLSEGGNGDGTLFYPGTVARIGGTHDIPIESMRLKRIRDGREDYEYLRILADRSATDKSYADTTVGTLFGTDAMWTVVASDALEQARRDLAERIAPSPPLTTTAATTTTALNCTKTGTSGDDVLVGTGGDDVLCGLGGNDIIRPGGGNDTVDGGTGTDRVSYDDAGAAVTINLYNKEAFGSGAGGTDKLVSIEDAAGSPFDDTVVGDVGVNRLYGNAGIDTMYGEGSGAFTSGGGDALYGGDGADKLFGYVGDDVLYGEGGADTLDGGPGSDTAAYGTSTAGVTVNLHNKEAFGTGAGGTDTLTSIENASGSPYVDTLVGDVGSNRLYGLGGTDTLYGEGSATFTAGAGDYLYGGDANDKVYGFVGNDYLYGEAGDDALDGGAGTDTCAQGTGVGTLTACEL
jgi:Ca2+-binding RTX toxin-like protein